MLKHMAWKNDITKSNCVDKVAIGDGNDMYNDVTGEPFPNE